MASRKGTSKTHKATWLGRAGTVTEHFLQSSDVGMRINVHVWDDTPEVARVRRIKGDGRTTNFMTFSDITMPVSQVDAYVAEMLRRESAVKA